jgi:DNA-binding PadR family transcriptional regulator
MAELLEIERLPDWVPEAALLYLLHTEEGVPLRVIARETGRHPSTVMRQVRRFENRRDDPLVDEALFRLGRSGAAGGATGVLSKDLSAKDLSAMPLHATSRPAKATAAPDTSARAPRPHGLSDDSTIEREARRVLRRLIEAGAVLAIAPDMEKAVVLKEASDGTATRIAVVARPVAQAFALKDWIACRRTGRVSTYEITAAGRAALRRLLAADAPVAPGMAEAPSPFAAQHGDWDSREIETEDGPARLRFNAAESPVAMLARRRDRDGKPFLAPELVGAAERLREDFEVAQMGPRVAQNWERFLTGGDRGGFGGGGPGDGPRAARERVAAALHDLGPGLADVALRCCCFLEGLEAAEQRMGWSARSGKVVLRIALTRLKRHYDSLGARARMIG